MNKPYRRALFIFRRDLRLHDNRGLNFARSQADQVLPCFMLDPRQVEAHPYRSSAALCFMYQALQDLAAQLTEQQAQLALLHGMGHELLSELQQTWAIDAVFVNSDYTPFSRQRDQQLQEQCARLGLAFHSVEDSLLNSPQKVFTHQGEPYRVFTAFYHRCRLPKPDQPQPLAAGEWLNPNTDPDWSLLEALTQNTPDIPRKGGRQQALNILQNITTCQNYTEQRDLPADDQTSHLSAHLKFGCCSVRETYHAIAHQLGCEHPLLRQLYWRDFFHHIAFHYPHVFKHAFQERYEKIPWQRDMDTFRAWSEGQTGFPIVDAGMRQLNATGWMPNRVRMIVASFLCKDLHISWRWGERYFAQRLVDYDPCLNNGNWQWAASTGCDAQPYFRIFNPWTQQQKFDPDCVYIKRWIPELANLPVRTIHQWHEQAHSNIDYPLPICDHKSASAQAKLFFQQANQDSQIPA